MRAFVAGCLVIVSMTALSGCAASAAAEDGVKDHQNHEEVYVPTHSNNGSAMAAKMMAPVTQ